MAEEHLSEEREEQPTARRLQKAREDGEIARSVEVPAAGVVLAGGLFLAFSGAGMAERFEKLFASGFQFDAARAAATTTLPALLGDQLVAGLLIVAPLLGLTMVAALLLAAIPGGYVFATKLAAPKLDRISPLNGLKRIFGVRSLVELAKSVGKVVLVGLAVWWLFASDFEQLMALGIVPVEVAIGETGALVAKSVLAFALAMALIATADAFYQRHAFFKRMRMSKQDIRDEMKDAEGRPEVKAQMRRRQRALATNRMIERVREADVVITNPEHFAVALSYDPEKEGAPVLVAKGADLVAHRIIEEAGKHGVHTLRIPLLARAVYFTTKLDRTVPEELYLAVAKVIAYVFNLNALPSSMRRPAQPVVEVPPEMRFDSQGRPLEGTKP